MPIRDEALRQIAMLRDVVEFKLRFYRCAWANYDSAKPGTLRLLPSSHHRNELARDYEKMKAMLFGDIPSFDAIESGLQGLEQEINARF